MDETTTKILRSITPETVLKWTAVLFVVAIEVIVVATLIVWLAQRA